VSVTKYGIRCSYVSVGRIKNRVRNYGRHFADAVRLVLVFQYYWWICFYGL